MNSELQFRQFIAPLGPYFRLISPLLVVETCATCRTWQPNGRHRLGDPIEFPNWHIRSLGLWFINDFISSPRTLVIFKWASSTTSAPVSVSRLSSFVAPAISKLCPPIWTPSFNSGMTRESYETCPFRQSLKRKYAPVRYRRYPALNPYCNGRVDGDMFI